MEHRHDLLRLSIIDDGHGFDTSRERWPGHQGLANMHARADALGGTLAVESDKDGTEVVFEMPRDNHADGKELLT